MSEKAVNEITVGVIDKSELFKAGVLQKLSTQQDFRLLDSDPGAYPLQFIEANSIDVVLLEIDSPMSKGLELSREITQSYPNTRIIVISPYFNNEELFETLKTGAAAYIDKRASSEELINIIRRVSRGEYPINNSVNANPEIADRVIRQFQEIASMGLIREKVAAPLTQREIQILSCIANGNTNKDVAHKLGISEQTIKNHVSAIMRKLNANDRAHAVALAIRNQWVTVDEI